jgi:hypothetical protein
MSDEAALRSMTLKVISDSSSYDVRSSDPAILPKNVKIEWGGEFIKGWTIASPTIATDSIAILHSPIGGAVLVFTFGLNPVDTKGILKFDNASLAQSIALMIKNGQVGFKGAALCIDSGSSSSAVQTAIPADSFYNFGANASTYVPNYTDLRSLCSL